MANVASQKRKIKRNHEKRKKQLREAQKRRRQKIKQDFNLKEIDKSRRAQNMRKYRNARKESVRNLQVMQIIQQIITQQKWSHGNINFRKEL